MKYYLAIDIGASSGRHILAHLEDGRIVLEEIHRFNNELIKKDGHLVWDWKRLFSEILEGMKKCKLAQKVPCSVGIDTWGVDFALLDEQGQIIGDTVGYRDSRTQGMDVKVYETISEQELYKRTGIQKQIFNTIYQLMAVKDKEPEKLEAAKSMLMIPDYFNYLLTGVKATEYTNASTTQLLNPKAKDWDYELIDKLGFPREIFQQIRRPGEKLGCLKEEVRDEVGFDCEVVLPATHDTGSAVMAVPVTEDSVLYISSGTWSLMGTELKEPICTEESRLKNLTNEGGYDYRFRYLKNIMGLWMINSARKELASQMPFSELCDKAFKVKINSIVDVNDDRFLAPESMADEVRNACAETGQLVPLTVFEVAAVIYNSLAKCYADTVSEIEAITKQHFNAIHIVGGGSSASLLNRLTAMACKRPVLAGPAEATSIGNVIAQMIAFDEFESLKDARKCVAESFEIVRYE